MFRTILIIFFFITSCKEPISQKNIDNKQLPQKEEINMPSIISNQNHKEDDESNFNSLAEALKNKLKVKTLYLVDKGYSEIPKEIFLFENIEHLFLSSNSIKEIPKDITKLKKLKRLHLGNNKIKDIPFFLKDLKHLESLNLQWNEITNIPESICDMKKLKVLVLLYHKSKKIPSCIFNLSELEYICLQSINSEYANATPEFKQKMKKSNPKLIID